MLTIADKTFTSRLFTGTGKYANRDVMAESILATGSELVTMALKRVNIAERDDDILAPLIQAGVNLLPNTSGAKNAKEAICCAASPRSIGDELAKIRNSPRSKIPDARSD